MLHDATYAFRYASAKHWGKPSGEFTYCRETFRPRWKLRGFFDDGGVHDARLDYSDANAKLKGKSVSREYHRYRIQRARQSCDEHIPRTAPREARLKWLQQRTLQRASSFKTNQMNQHSYLQWVTRYRYAECCQVRIT